MQAPIIPADEQERLQALQSLSLLDTPPEEAFDRVVALAASLLRTPIALFTLVDEERQWFKANVGLEASETPREISFCGHAILGDELFVVEDARADPRFADNPLVTNDPRIRMYAGCPVRAPGGQRIGTLCVIDRQPHRLEPPELEALAALAGLIESEVRLRAYDSAQLTRLREFVEHAPAAIAFLNRDLRYLGVSRRWVEDYRLPPGSLVGRHHYEVFPEISPEWRASHQRCLAGAVESHPGERFPRPDGSVDWVRWENRPWHKPDGSVGGLVIHTEVVTAAVRQRIVRQLGLDLLTPDEGEAPYPIMREILAPRFGEVLGADPQSVQLRPPGELQEPQSDTELQFPLLSEDRELGTLICDPRRVLNPEELAWLVEVAGLLDLALGRYERQLQLDAAQRRHSSLFAANGGPLLVVDHDNRVLEANPAAHALLGCDELGCDLIEDGIAEEHRERFAQALLAAREGELPPPFETNTQDGDPSCVVHSSGRRRRLVSWILRRWDHGPAGAVIASGQDVTRRHELEEQLRQSQKLESIGRLAGGVAHDFNNMLTAILGFTDLALADARPEQRRLRDTLERVKEAAASSAALTAQLLAFSRRQSLAPEVVEVGRVVRTATAMLEPILGEQIKLLTRIDEDGGHVKVDPSQLQQAVVNLAVNARDAMPKGGQITLTTGRRRLEAAELRSFPEAQPGDYALISLRDDGHGMSADVLSRACEPFFTTKPRGQGTGLGLPSVHGFVAQSRGALRIESEPGQGTLVEVCLPLVPPERAARPASGLVRAVSSEGRSLLVAEDDPMIRELFSELLGRAGHRATLCADGLEALEVLSARAAEIDLLVSDVVMPNLGGIELVERAHRLRPDLPILLMSGYTARPPEELEQIPGLSEVHFLRKPVTPRDLLAKVEALLAGRPRDA